MITIVTWLWEGNKLYYAWHAKALAEMFKRHFTFDYRFMVITDNTQGDFGDNTVVFPTPQAAATLADIVSPEGLQYPSCYRRLWLFSEDAWVLGDRILLTDVDIVVTGDWAPLVARHEPFVGWRPISHWGRLGPRLAGGMWMLTTRTHTEVWEDFIANPQKAIAETHALGYRGSDQAWITRKLVDTVPVWGPQSGILIHRECLKGLPKEAKVVHFKGKEKPWSPEAKKKYSWLKDYWPKI